VQELSTVHGTRLNGISSLKKHRIFGDDSLHSIPCEKLCSNIEIIIHAVIQSAAKKWISKVFRCFLSNRLGF